ncbi:hypothetical protein K502DRAFT_341381 [Neoconidiobolus thromboides FSU 785]|nr:hypothetical protein K502DRAFT_341381 [Neoconidiobolus thromboides FSU 785]
MASSRQRQPPISYTHNEDMLTSSDEGEDPQRQTERTQYRSNGNRQNNAHQGSSPPSSATSISDQGRSPLAFAPESIDPLVNQAIVSFMISTRKRHLKLQREYKNKQIKAARTRHNLFFSNNPEYKVPLYDLNTKASKNGSKAQEATSSTRGNYASQTLSATQNQMHSNEMHRYKSDQTTSGYQPEVDIKLTLESNSVPRLNIPSPVPSTLDNKAKTVWAEICETIPLVHRQASISTLSKYNMYRNLGVLCQREVKKATYRRLKHTREIPNKARRATREMLTFWRRNEKDEREARKRAERELLEKQRQEEEAREAKRQEKKLNFLITQTELYGHFVSKRLENKDKKDDDEEEGDAVDFKEMDFDADDKDIEEKAKLSAQHALKLQRDRTKKFDSEVKKRQLEGEQEEQEERRLDGEEGMDDIPDDDQMNFQDPSTMQQDSNILQPRMLTCELKSYQLKGLNWLANLYEQGINGILADEMGLGKTVQSIALLAHLAETHNIWGPFLIVAPASTLHNWEQELTRFAPTFKLVPYWGSAKDRKILRQKWNSKLYTRNAEFHVVITSYQLIVNEPQYFQRIKWQYMILDEAQAIKSSASARWKVLLNFHCRNRLLLTGTPIQNSMQELWALLHFIMPSLFDSHEEFSEWFSKDIEKHAEKNGALDQHQLRRLHLILKPFMLRRVKKNVQNELGEKIELEVKCQLTPRQRQLYASLREKISLAELLEKSRSSLENDSVESLMNLVIQFRKVCNHPELFERAEVKSPFSFCNYPVPPPVGDFNSIAYNPVSHISISIPRLFYQDGGIIGLPSLSSNYGTLNKLLNNTFNIWKAANINESLMEMNTGFSFLSLSNLSPTELERVQSLDLITLYELSIKNQNILCNEYLRDCLDPENNTVELMTPSSLLKDLNSFKEYSSLKDSYFLDAQSLKLTSCAKPIVVAPSPNLSCSDLDQYRKQKHFNLKSATRNSLLGLPIKSVFNNKTITMPSSFPENDTVGYSDIWIPDPAKLIMNSGKLMALDKLLTKLKAEGHRVLLYFQMTKMIDLMEEFLTYRQHSYLRLDGSSKISERRDLVADWQSRPDLFIFLLSTRAGGLGINLTAADTVIFYDSDWNPTVDQQAMDRAHRLGQTKQVTVYRLVTQNTIEERILMRAKQKDAIHRVVIAGGDYKADLKPKEIFSLLLDDEEGNNNEVESEGNSSELNNNKGLIEIINNNNGQENQINSNGEQVKSEEEVNLSKRKMEANEDEIKEVKEESTSQVKKVRVEDENYDEDIN